MMTVKSAVRRGAAVVGHVWVAIAVALVCLAGFVFLADSVPERDGFTVWDLPIASWIAAHRSAGLDNVAVWFGDGTAPAVVAVVSVAVAGFLWWRRQYRAAIVLAAASSLAVVVTTVAKLLVGRSRPLAPLNVIPETEPSFPSGHVLVAGVVVAVTIMLLWAHLSRVGRAVALGLGTMTVLAVCADRLVLGAHWTTDVLASLALTGIIAAGAWVLALLLRTVADSFVVTLN